MIHMHAVPANWETLHTVRQPRMVYLTNSEFDQSGKARAIHSHADITEVGIIYHGHGIHVLDGEKFYSEPGDLLLYNTDVLHQDFAQGEEPMRVFLCGISDLHIQGLPPGHIVRGPEDYLLKSGVYLEFLMEGFERIEAGLRDQTPHIAVFAQGFLQSLIAVINSLTDSNERDFRGPQTERLSLPEQMRRYIDQNYSGKFSLEELADRFHINRYYASHVFSKAFGCSPMQYRTRRRIGEAQSLLISSDCSITYIASVIGYDDPNRFSQIFSKIVGMSPSKYRDLSVRSPQPVHKKKK